MIGLSSDIIIFNTTATIYVGMFLYIHGMREDTKNRLSQLIENAGPESNQFVEPIDAWSNYVHEIDHHATMIEYLMKNSIIFLLIYWNYFEFPVIFSVADSLCDMMNLIIFVITFTCIIVIAFNLFVLELANAIDITMLSAFVDSGIVIGLTVVYFYLSEWITGDLLDIGEIFYNSPWYRLPPKQQTLIKLPIQRAQREIRLSAFGLFGCSLPVFASVLSDDVFFFIRGLS